LPWARLGANILSLGSTLALATALLFAVAAPALAQRAASSGSACGGDIGLAVPPGGGTGTAAILLHRREIVTNLHVVDHRCTGNTRFSFWYGYSNGRSRASIGATIVARGNYCRSARRGTSADTEDWAIAVLDRDPAAGGRMSQRPMRPLGLYAGSMSNLESANGRYFLMGYGMAFRSGQTPYASPACSVSPTATSDVVEHSCFASARSSGAPIVFRTPQGACKMIALHFGELRDGARGGRHGARRGGASNVAILSRRFEAAASAVARELNQGKSATQIAADLRR